MLRNEVWNICGQIFVKSNVLLHGDARNHKINPLSSALDEENLLKNHPQEKCSTTLKQSALPYKYFRIAISGTSI
jgi:hypothetical protein